MASANGAFGGLRREINWDGVPDLWADPKALPANFCNLNSPRGAVFSTPVSGFLVSADAGSTPAPLFGFGNDLQAFNAQRLFKAVNSNTTDVHFFLPGTTTATTTRAFGVVFVDAEVAGLTRLPFFDGNDALIYTHDAAVAGNQGFSFLGATVSGAAIARVCITSGLTTILANGALGNPIDDLVVMDDFCMASHCRLSLSRLEWR